MVNPGKGRRRACGRCQSCPERCGAAELSSAKDGVQSGLHWLLQEPRRHPVLPPAFWTRMQDPGTLRRSEAQLEGDVGSPWSPLHLGSSHHRP